MTADEYIQQARAILNTQHAEGSGQDLLDKLLEWARQLNLTGMAQDALHCLYHFVVDELVPRIMELTPPNVDIAITVIVTVLKKLHDAYFPH